MSWCGPERHYLSWTLRKGEELSPNQVDKRIWGQPTEMGIIIFLLLLKKKEFNNESSFYWNNIIIIKVSNNRSSR